MLYDSGPYSVQAYQWQGWPSFCLSYSFSLLFSEKQMLGFIYKPKEKWRILSQRQRATGPGSQDCTWVLDSPSILGRSGEKVKFLQVLVFLASKRKVSDQAMQHVFPMLWVLELTAEHHLNSNYWIFARFQMLNIFPFYLWTITYLSNHLWMGI